MAAGGIPTKKKTGLSPQEARLKLQLNIERLQAMEDKNAQARVADLQMLKDKSDEYIQELDLRELGDDVEMKDADDALNDPGATGNHEQGHGAEDGKSADESTKQDEQKPKKTEEERGNGTSNPKKVRIQESIEKGKHHKGNGFFESETDSCSDFDSETESVLDSETESKSPSKPSRDVYMDPDFGKALHTFQKTGVTSVKGVTVETVAWAKPRGRTIFINRYITKNKKSVARYRLSSSCFPETYEDLLPVDKNASDQTCRYGDAKLPGNRQKYTKRHVRAILGIAWKCGGFEVDRDDLDLINPDLVENYRSVPTYILIAWEINGVVKKTWEPRKAIRDRFEKADELIYHWALESEDRHDEYMAGKRTASTRSPSVSDGLGQDKLRELRESSLKTRSTPSPRSTPSRSTRSSKSPKPKDSPVTTDADREDFLTSWLELLGISSGNLTNDLKKLHPSDKKDCIVAWQEYKAELVGATR